MKFNFKVEVDATELEMRQFAIDTLTGVAVKTIGKVSKNIDNSAPALMSVLQQMGAVKQAVEQVTETVSAEAAEAEPLPVETDPARQVPMCFDCNVFMDPKPSGWLFCGDGRWRCAACQNKAQTDTTSAEEPVRAVNASVPYATSPKEYTATSPADIASGAMQFPLNSDAAMSGASTLTELSGAAQSGKIDPYAPLR